MTLNSRINLVVLSTLAVGSLTPKWEPSSKLVSKDEVKVTHLIKFKGDYIKPNPPKQQLRMPNLLIQFKAISLRMRQRTFKKKKKKRSRLLQPAQVTLTCLAVGERSAAGRKASQGHPFSSSGVPGGDHEVTHPGRFQGYCEETYLS